MKHPDMPSRAKTALAETFEVKVGETTLTLRNFPMRALIRLHDTRSPLFYPGEPPEGLPSGWLLTAYILAAEKGDLAGKTLAQLRADASEWSEMFGEFEWVPALAETIKAQWMKFATLDPPDIAEVGASVPASPESPN